ncbi:hypothetical protein CVT25_011774 [Psilocybe cyanescens]|uniref:MICOS complex subunit n=1 Tax=Psilocybe cyanescens TaxID=93625 RepID=A0A409WJ64_PSICY|nr:hypothetical protein CVT25_011774 [Psilocybe cyanescens]
MFRFASRLPRRALLSATVAGTAVGLHDPQKLSIYPAPVPDVLLVESPSVLEKEIGVVRRHAMRAYADAHAHVQGWVSKWIGVEHAVENRVKAIISPEESMTPGLLYVGVATLTGSILGRNRILPTRLLLPPIFLLASADYFLPKTSGNLSAYLGSLEDTYFPAFAQKHEVAKAHSQMTWERVKEATKSGRERLDDGASSAVDKVQEVTGLKLKETLGWGKETAQEVVEIAKEAKAVVEKKVEEAEKLVEKDVEVVEKKVEKKEEVKRLV